MDFEIKTVRDLTHAILNTPDVENPFGAPVSPPIEIQDSEGFGFEITEFYLRGDDVVSMKIKKL